VQACGDCHVANFGGFGTPERQLVLYQRFRRGASGALGMGRQAAGASIILAMRRGIFPSVIVFERCSPPSLLPGAYARVRGNDRAGCMVLASERRLFMERAKTPAARKPVGEDGSRISHRYLRHEFPNCVHTARATSHPSIRRSLIYHPRTSPSETSAAHVSEVSRHSARRAPHTFDRYELVDVAAKLSAWARGYALCVALLIAGPRDPLILQFQGSARIGAGAVCGAEAGMRTRGSAWSPASDFCSRPAIFSRLDQRTAWPRFLFSPAPRYAHENRHEKMSKQDWLEYVELLWVGCSLARMPAPATRRASGYLGKSRAFDEAIAKFAVLTRTRTERTNAMFVKALRGGRLSGRRLKKPPFYQYA